MAHLDAVFTATQAQLREYVDAMALQRSALRWGHGRSPAELAQDAEAAHEALEIERPFAEASTDLENAYGHLCQGIRTDWNSVLAALQWTERYLAHIASSWQVTATGRTRPGEGQCAEAACSVERIGAARQLLKELDSVVATVSEELAFHNEIFVETAMRPGGAHVNAASVRDLEAWLEVKIGSIGKLSEWIHFREIREECAAAGIDDFISHALDVNVPANRLEDALRKQLLVLQLDAIYRQSPHLRKFQRQDHERLIGELRKPEDSPMRRQPLFVKLRSSEGSRRRRPRPISGSRLASAWKRIFKQTFEPAHGRARSVPTYPAKEGASPSTPPRAGPGL